MTKSEYYKTYYKKNKEKILKRSADWYLNNKERIKERNLPRKKFLADYKKNYANKNKKSLYVKRKERIEKYPWVRTYYNISSRCQSLYYKKRGIKCLIKISELKELWERDKAHLLSYASIDRIDGKQSYTLDNCRFIELRDNVRKQNHEWKNGTTHFYKEVL